MELSSLNERQRRHLTSNHLRDAKALRGRRKSCAGRGGRVRVAVGSNGSVVERAGVFFN
mgnify:CR=1 FL=1